MLALITKYFEKIGTHFCRKMGQIIPAMMSCGSCNTSEIAAHMSQQTGDSFKTNEMRIARFLQSCKFQINDTFWRCYIKLVLHVFAERTGVKGGENVNIFVDFTSICDDFLIMAASVVLGSKSIPVYFSLRLYPKRKNQMNQKKMEEAFIKALAHILPKRYRYIIVADRGFGNHRFISLCEQLGFQYVIRINENLNIKTHEDKMNLESLSCNFDINCHVISWKHNARIVGNAQKGSFWYLITNNSDLSRKDVVKIYEQRFKIEFMFRDEKSSGFKIESSKIKKYDRMKRMLFCVIFSHFMATTVGEIIQTTNHPLKKNFPAHIDCILACFKWGEELSCVSSNSL